MYKVTNKQETKQQRKHYHDDSDIWRETVES